MQPASTPYSAPLFSNSQNQGNNQDNEIESKIHKRQEQFSNQQDYSEIKANTMTNELSLGQNYRNKIFMQKRLKRTMNIESTQSLKNNLTIPLDLFERCNDMTIELSKFPDIIKAFRSQDTSQKYTGLVGIRKLLTLQSSPIQELIDIGITPELISLLDNSPPEFQYEALWCLTNIATGTSDQANSIVVKGGIPKILKLMDSPIEELKIQSIWIIGNLASDCQKIRDTLLKEKAFDKLLTILFSTDKVQLIKQTTWAISNFFRVKPSPPYDIVQKCLKMIARSMVMLPTDQEFLIDACFILYYMTEHYKDTIKDLLDINIIPRIIQNLDIDVTFIQINCLRIVGNIAAGTQKQIETLISEDFLPILSQAIKTDEPEIKKECIWAVCNLTSVENPEYLKKILEQGILTIICECLKMEDAKYLAVCLEAVGNL